MWLRESRKFLVETIGLREDLLGWDVHEGDGLAHYARACTDITFQFPFGTQELMGIAARGDYDLRQHSDGSGKSTVVVGPLAVVRAAKDLHSSHPCLSRLWNREFPGLEYFDEQTKERYMPHCIEPSLGVDRLMLALICSAYAEDEVGGEKRSLLKFNPRVAPIKVSVLPLVKNKPQLVEVARGLFDNLRKRWNCQWDTAGAIGRRYRRADEVGTPFCVTVDFDTIEKDNTVTIRDRDTTEQVRVPIDEVIPYLSKAIDGY
jgi:glycyl-tRNA synthetase